MASLVRVAVFPETETLHTRASRDHYGTWCEIPEDLVAAHEQAQAAYEAAQEAITTHIDERHLQEQEEW